MWDCEVYDENFKAKFVWLQMFSVGHLLKKRLMMLVMQLLPYTICVTMTRGSWHCLTVAYITFL
jgi:hypothetical protein